MNNMKKTFFGVMVLMVVLMHGNTAKALTYGDTCVLTFIGYDGKAIVAQYQVPYGDPFIAPDMPEQPGYKFLGWYTGSGYKANFDHVTSHMVVYARCEITQYQVSFYDETGQLVGSCMVRHGEAAVPPSTIVTEKVDGTFKYVLMWNQDFSCVTGNMIVQAQRVKALIAGNRYKASNGYRYMAVSDTQVHLIGTKKGKSIKSLTVPASVRLGGVNCVVTGVGSGAFKDCKVLSKVIIGSNVSSIGKKAFYDCKNLKSVRLKTSVLQTVGPKAFKGVSSKVELKMPKTKKAAYRVLIKSGGAPIK